MRGRMDGRREGGRKGWDVPEGGGKGDKCGFYFDAARLGDLVVPTEVEEGREGGREEGK